MHPFGFFKDQDASHDSVDDPGHVLATLPSTVTEVPCATPDQETNDALTLANDDGVGVACEQQPSPGVDRSHAGPWIFGEELAKGVGGLRPFPF
jgi:hypothetical protein